MNMVAVWLAVLAGLVVGGVLGTGVAVFLWVATGAFHWWIPLLVALTGAAAMVVVSWSTPAAAKEVNTNNDIVEAPTPPPVVSPPPV